MTVGPSASVSSHSIHLISQSSYIAFLCARMRPSEAAANRRKNGRAEEKKRKDAGRGTRGRRYLSAGHAEAERASERRKKCK